MANDFIEFKKLYFDTRDRDYSERSFNLMMYRKVLEGELYGILEYPFHQVAQDYNTLNPICISKRRPDITYSLCKIVVDDVVSFLFGEDKFPTVKCNDPEVSNSIQDIIKESSLQLTMIDAATRGSVGSVVILVKIIEGRIYYEVLDSEYLTPIFNPMKPDELIGLKQKYKLYGCDLEQYGYDNMESKSEYWWEREWTTMEDIVYEPYLVDIKDEKEKKKKKVKDKNNSVVHNLGFVPAVWIKNLPGSNGIDGLCTFSEAINISIAIDYHLSQCSRGVMYNGEPTLMIKEGMLLPVPGDEGPRLNATEGNILHLDREDDAKYLEISGDGARTALELIKYMRQLGMENIHGNHSDPDKNHFSQSGVAAKAQNQSMIWVADKLRVTYGETGLRNLIQIIRKINQQHPVIINNETFAVNYLKADEPIALVWADWYSATPDDRAKDAQTYKTLKDSGLISTHTAIHNISSEYEIDDIEKEKKQIKDEQEEFKEEMQPSVTETITA